MAVQGGDVAVTDDPFGVTPEGGAIDSVEDADGAVAAARTKDGVDAVVVDVALQQGGAMGVVASHLVVFAVESRFDNGLQLPRPQQCDGRLHLLGADFPGGGHQGYPRTRM